MGTSSEKFRIDYTRRVRTRSGYTDKQIEKFHSKYTINSDSSCWEWKDSLDKNGYGRIRFGSIVKKAHRVSWELHNSTIPSDLNICHICDNPKCVNPDHLFIGSAKDNVHDMLNKGRYVNGNIKLSSEDLNYIRTYPKTYGSGRLLATFFNVHEGHITRIRRSI